MNETQEASWYEIALTHSQVVKIFVVLLVCLVGAFFSGVWIGRDAVNAVENVPPQATAQVPAEQGEATEELAQLHFFTEDEVVPSETVVRQAPAAEPAPQQSPAAGDSADTTLADDVDSPPAPARIAGNDPDAAVSVTREPAPREPAAQERVAQQPAAQQPGTSASASGDLVVQVFSSNDATQARRVLGRLAQSGHPAYLSPVEVEGRTMYRVRIGPYAERAQAERIADSVRRTFRLDTWITQKST